MPGVEFPDRHILLRTLDSSSDGILILDAREDSLPIAYANEVAASLYGTDKPSLIGRVWPVLERRDPASDRLRKSLEAREEGDCLINGERPDGTRWCRQARVRPLLDEAGDCECIVVQLGVRIEGRIGKSKATEKPGEPGPDLDEGNQRSRNELRPSLVPVDAYAEALRRDFAIARRQSLELTVIVFEVPELATYRSTFGTNAADSCMRMIAKQVTSVLRRGSDLSAQIDDSRIIATLVGQGASEAQALAEQICRNVVGLKLHNPHGRSGRFLGAEPSVIQANPDKEDADDFLARATAGAIVAGMIGQLA